MHTNSTEKVFTVKKSENEDHSELQIIPSINKLRVALFCYKIYFGILN